ncbi:MAG: DUF4738 domain-containing protein [Bacteroidaceae bacterium]|nr:DUF4738 domain-containing protein [Bacteroidaceae bacterium]
MKKSSLIILFSYSLIFFTSCGPQKIEQEGSDQTDQDNDGVWELPNYAYTDSLMQGSHKVVYTITSQPDEQLPEVVDEDGVKFKDNRFQLLIMKDGKQLFNRSFTKADFKSQLSEDFQKFGIMDGLRFNHAEEGKLYFNTCVSFPDSDMSCPFLLTIGPDGSYTITPDTTFGEEDEEFPSV